MYTVNKNIEAKITFSEEKLQTFKDKLSKSAELLTQKELCIYTTGSFGRLEACEYSDIDLFFLSDNGASKFSKISKTLIDADIINICREMNFPEFSGDGTYLEVHGIEDMYSQIGSREDDYRNLFTARMLLLLESKPIYNADFYNKMLHTTVDKYYKDFHRHEINFKPVFLVNDVIRFWRTICLNYEHSRNRKFSNSGLSKNEIEYKTNESHIKNLKLKFSRKLTCYSFLLSVLCSKAEVLKQNDILDIIKLTPLQRLNALSVNPEMENEVKELIVLYFWYLKIVQVDKPDLIKWIAIESNRNEAFGNARKFSKIIFNLMIKAKNQEALMYFLV